MLKRFYGSICGSSKCMVRISVDKCLLETSLSISRVWPHVLSLKSTVHNTEATRARPVTKYGASGWKQKAIEFCASGIMTSCAIAGALWRQFTQHCMATRSRTRLNTIAENVRRSDRSPHPAACGGDPPPPGEGNRTSARRLDQPFGGRARFIGDFGAGQHARDFLAAALLGHFDDAGGDALAFFQRIL